MKSVNIRKLTHHFAVYLKAVKRGERVVILERSRPVADIIPHNENLSAPGWKRPISKIKVKGLNLAETVSKMRDEER